MPIAIVESEAILDVSVLIPTRGRPAKAAACVAALGRQTLEPDRYEVLVGLDGDDPETAGAVREAWPTPRREALGVVACERSGAGPVRNRLLPHCRGRTLVVLNDDVCPGPRFLEVHCGEQRRCADEGRPAVIVGHSPWVGRPPAEDRLFDRLVRETSMVFFYDRMDAADPGRDWGFRHAWGLNTSMPLDAVRAVEGWTAFPNEYGYDDIEIAWRLRRRFSLSVLYRPRAQALHDHRFGPEEYLRREHKLGRSAWLYARRNPGFARDVFGRDITSGDELDYSREFIERERAMASRARIAFEKLADLPADAVDGPHAAALLDLLYQQHLPLKRWMWRAGLLAAATGRGPGNVEWP